MEARLASLEAKFESVVPTLATKSDLAELRADMHEMNAGISRWMLGTTITIIGTVVLGFAGLIYNLSGSKQSSAPQTPIIITVPGQTGATPPTAPTPTK